MAKFQSLAKQYCAVVKLNQKKARIKEIIKSHHSVAGLQLEKKDNWLNMFISNSDLHIIYLNNNA